MLKDPGRITDSLDNSEKEIRIIILSGQKNVERVIFALAYAYAISLLGGSKLSIFLSMDGACFTDESMGNEASIPNYYSVAEYFALLLESNVEISVCGTCINNYCTKYKKGKIVIRPGIQIKGLTTICHRINKINTIVF